MIRMRLFLVQLAVVLVIGRVALSFADDKEQAPSANELSRSLNDVKALFGDAFARAKNIRTVADRRAALAALVDEILKTNAATTNSTDRYALLQVARQIAVYGQDFQTALAVIDTTAAGFEIDALAMKVSALISIGSELENYSDHAAIVPAMNGLLNLAVRANRLELTKTLVDAALDSAKRSRNRTLLEEVQASAEAFASYERAVAILDQAPDDPEANSIAGKFLCVSQGDWESGVSHLALGTDKQLQQVAVAELKATTAATGGDTQLEIADLWWKIADGAKDAEQKAFRNRARDWYKKVLPGLPQGGLAYRRVEGRLQEAEAENEDELPKYAQDFIGSYIYQAASKKSGESAYAVWQFREDNEVLENGVVIAKWAVADQNRIKVELAGADEDPMFITPRNARSVNGTRDAKNDTWRWQLDRLEAKRWEHKTESIEIFGREIDGGTELLTFYSNGRINDPLGSITWRIQGNQLTIDWGDDKTTEATIGGGGRTYSGKTRQPTGFGRTRLTLPVTGRLMAADE